MGEQQITLHSIRHRFWIRLTSMRLATHAEFCINGYVGVGVVTSLREGMRKRREETPNCMAVNQELNADENL